MGRPTTESLPRGSGRESDQSALSVIDVRPFLLILHRRSHAPELMDAIQRAGVPCLLAVDPQMTDYWSREGRPGIFVVELGSSWTREASTKLICQGATVVGLSDDEEERIQATNQGFREVFPLTLSPREIALRLQSRFCGHPPLPVELPEVEGPLRMDVAERRVWWWDVERKVSRFQFDVLAYFAARPKSFIPIDTLKREVWRQGFGDHNKVHKIIGRIRHALGPDAASYLVSEAGYYGYMPR